MYIEVFLTISESTLFLGKRVNETHQLLMSIYVKRSGKTRWNWTESYIFINLLIFVNFFMFTIHTLRNFHEKNRIIMWESGKFYFFVLLIVSH